MRNLLLLIPSLLLSINACKATIFETPSGKVRGVQMQSRGGKNFSAFRGIPFAKPPIGDLRFSAPVAADPWTDVLDATEDANICMQENYLFFRHPEVEGSEDCLYINVYTPLKNQDSKKVYPVMVNIFYGGFTVGSSKSTLTGPKFLMDEGIVFVTFNYRLGIFGFYSTLDDASWGNYGLKDQVLALRWIQKHIASFGGDPNAVTIFGQSAGGTSVHHHILSPSSRGLFHRAIVQSGTALAYFGDGFNDLQRSRYKSFANASGCDSDADTKTVVKCLRNIDAKKLMEIQDTFKYFQSEPIIMFTFVIEKQTEKNPEPFLTESPVEIIKRGDFSRVPLMLGVVEDEGMLRTTSLLRQADTLKEMNENFDTYLPQMLLLSYSVPEDIVPNLWNSLKNFYLDGANEVDVNNPKSVQGFTNLYSDRMFNYNTYQTAIMHSLKGHRPIWLYRFSYKGKYSYGDVFAVTNETIDYNGWGPAHCDELIYLLDSPDLPFGDLEEDDLYMSQNLVKIWTGFVTSVNVSDPVQGWKPIVPVDPSNSSNFSVDFLHFTKDAHKQEISNDFFLNRMNFWKKLLIHENSP